MPTIETNVIPGGAVYGVPQVTYTVDGEAGKDYSAALAVASLLAVVAVFVAV